MQDEQLLAIEIQGPPADISPEELETENPQDLLIASIKDGLPPIQHCSGVLLGANRQIPMNTALVDCTNPEHFVHILEQGHFCLEIPTESFISELITEKVLNAPPKMRTKTLARIMHERNISRVLILAPQAICKPQPAR